MEIPLEVAWNEVCDGKLQWGHVQNDVEIPRRRPPPRTTEPLQWGHVQNDVEIFTRAALIVALAGFNGATCKMTWKFQLVITDEKGEKNESFNGATCKMTWKLTLTHLSAKKRKSFNGATCKMTWKLRVCKLFGVCHR